MIAAMAKRPVPENRGRFSAFIVAHKGIAAIVSIFCFGAILFAAGWFVRGAVDTVPAGHALRLGGYKLIDPLLVCNISNQSPTLEDRSLEGTIQGIIDSHKRSGDISKASVYINDFSSGTWGSIYGNETYFPSSLGKIPIMIAYYLEAESDPDILSKRVLFPVGSPDLNDMQDITPENAIVEGNTYTIADLIDYMIRYSDNNATALLDKEIDPNMLDKVYGDLGIPVNNNPNLSNIDFITAHQVATLFRVLYNATYLSRTDSENALELLSQTSFTQGIVAGVSSSTVVAHKLGLVGIAPNNVTTEHELHDCGIVYGKDAYVLCVMTRGSGSIPALEGVISQISAAARSNLDGN